MAPAEAQYEAPECLRELVDDLIDGCLATQAKKGSLGLVTELCCLLRPRTTASINTICTTAAKRRVLAGNTVEDRPCMWCGDASKHATMVLCDHCNAYYHPQCAEDSDERRLMAGHGSVTLVMASSCYGGHQT